MSRNLFKYPITYGEACEAVQEAQQLYYDKYSKHIGGTSGISLLLVEQFIRENKDAFEIFAKSDLPVYEYKEFKL